jgi:hypothetical protein
MESSPYPSGVDSFSVFLLETLGISIYLNKVIKLAKLRSGYVPGLHPERHHILQDQAMHLVPTANIAEPDVQGVDI